MYTLDTNIIIYYTKEDPRVVSSLEKMYTRNEALYVSALTEIELFRFPHLSDVEAAKIEQFLKSTAIIPVDSQIA